MTTVSHILALKGRDVETVAPGRTIGEVVAILAAKRIGAVVVTDADDTVLGILSERDVVRLLAGTGTDALGDPVTAHMTARVVTCGPEMRIVEVMEQMTSARFRHVPVMEDGRLAGIVSIGDLVKHRLAEIEAEHQALRDYIATA